MALSYSISDQDPQTYEEALHSALHNQWTSAMQAEYASLIENNTFTPVTDTNSHKPIGCKWVYKTKKNPNGSQCYKARLMIKG